jgi:hypothetical protein
MQRYIIIMFRSPQPPLQSPFTSVNNVLPDKGIPLELNSNASQASANNSQTFLPNVFGRIISSSQQAAYIAIKDKCPRPTLTYNKSYNLELLRDNLLGGYSLYI